MKVYIDTNILIDLVCLREPFAEQAQKLFALGYIGKLSLITSALSFVNTIYIGRKYNYVDVREKLNEISQFVHVADLKGDTAIWALSCPWKDYEDATQSQSAVIESADCIVTRNKKDFLLSPIPVYTIEELWKQLME